MRESEPQHRHGCLQHAQRLLHPVHPLAGCVVSADAAAMQDRDLGDIPNGHYVSLPVATWALGNGRAFADRNAAPASAAASVLSTASS